MNSSTYAMLGILTAAALLLTGWARNLRFKKLSTERDSIRAMHPHAIAGLTDIDLCAGVLYDRDLWQKLGKRKGIHRLAHNARCLVRLMQIVALKGLVSPEQVRSIVGSATTIAFLTWVYPVEAAVRSIISKELPFICGHLIVGMYAQLEGHVQALLEGKNDDALSNLRGIL